MGVGMYTGTTQRINKTIRAKKRSQKKTKMVLRLLSQSPGRPRLVTDLVDKGVTKSILGGSAFLLPPLYTDL